MYLHDPWPYTVTGGPWPERHGRRARVIPEPVGPPRYPWSGISNSYAVVLIENDPYDIHDSNGVAYSCVLERSSLAAATP